MQLGLVQSYAHREIGCKPDRLTHLWTPSTEAQCGLHGSQPFQSYSNGNCASTVPVARLATCETHFHSLPQRQAVVGCDLPSSSSNFLGAFTARFARSEDILLRRRAATCSQLPTPPVLGTLPEFDAAAARRSRIADVLECAEKDAASRGGAVIAMMAASKASSELPPMGRGPPFACFGSSEGVFISRSRAVRLPR